MASYTYELDDLFNVLKMTEADGTFWDYGYDDRYRLTSAVRNNASQAIKANYAYTYDASDNMLTKTEPFEDTFNDAVFDGWPTWSGTWTAAGGVLAKTSSGDGAFRKHTSDADGEFRMDYRITDTGTNDFFRMRLRSIAPDDYIYVQIRPALITLVKKINGVWTVLDSQSVSTTEDQWYTLRAEYEGSDVTVWRSTDGELESEILTTSSAEPTTTSLVALSLHDTGGGATAYEFDNIRVLADDLDTETTFTVNDADELVSSTTTYGGTTYYEYDAWGRMTRKYMGSSGSPTFEATYDYKYDDKLVAVNSDFPDEGNVSYTYGADGQRRSRTAGGVTTKYNWGMGAILNEEDGAGNLTQSFIGKAARLSGTNPASSTYDYFLQEGSESIRHVVDQSLQQVGTKEYSPYGRVLIELGNAGDYGFTGLSEDRVTGLVHTAYRNFNPEIGRWLTREPTGLDGPNLYAYALLNPVSAVDPTGLSSRFWSDASDLGWAVLDGIIPWKDPFEDRYADPTGCVHRAHRIAKFAGSTIRNVGLILLTTGFGFWIANGSRISVTAAEAFVIGRTAPGILVEKMLPRALPLYRGGGGILAGEGVVDFLGEATGIGGPACR